MARRKKERKETNTDSRAYRVIYKIFAGVIGWWLFNIRVVGGENEPENGGYIVCGNHTSATDAIALCYAFRKHQVRLMAKKELFRIPVLAPLIRLLGAFPVDRGGSDVGAIKTAVKMVKEGKCMGMFPQGHRYPGVDPRTTPTKNGAALIATRAEADVVPVYVMRKKNRFKLFRRTWVVIGTPISHADFAYDPSATGEYARITDRIFDEICRIGEGFDPKAYKTELKARKKQEKKDRKEARRKGRKHD